MTAPPATFPPYQPPFADDSLSPDEGAHNPWFQRVATVEGAIVYRIRDKPVATAETTTKLTFGPSFEDVDEYGSAVRWRWMTADRGSLTAIVGGPPRTFVLSFGTSSFNKPRTLRLATYCSSIWFRLSKVSRCSSASASASVRTAGLPDAIALTSA